MATSEDLFRCSKAEKGKRYDATAQDADAVARVVVAMLLIAWFGFCNSSPSPAFAEKKNGSEDLFVNRGPTHFVAMNGSDDGPGTAERPWATINYSAEQAEAGDTVVVRGGRYALLAQVRPRNSGRPGALWWKRDFPPKLIRSRFDRSDQ